MARLYGSECRDPMDHEISRFVSLPLDKYGRLCVLRIKWEVQCSNQNLVVPTIINNVVWMKLGDLRIFPHMSSFVKTSWQSRYLERNMQWLPREFLNRLGRRWVSTRDEISIELRSRVISLSV